ncbi:unnamed protein product [Musa acuminata subsp. malaccensis]|uniref:(wild Malaysian banana) hypothetical protein n=1 Tax=Musa acuminata subsp. malaccensis TaxID=214687 RepID=A0A804HTV3_MUSAM|nr:unnamed protein product [Musa acuminata subsp. malaccensis]
MLSPSTVPLLLSFAAAAVTGAAAFLALRRFSREETVASLRQDVRDAVLLLREPPTVLVTGFRAHGKSSFINTACRALAAEAGPMLLRAETSPPVTHSATFDRCVIRAAVAGGGSEDEKEEGEATCAQVALVDAPALPEPGQLTRADVEEALSGVPPPECVALVLRCGGPAKDRHAAVKKLADVTTAIRQRGLQFVVVLTHKKRIKSMRKAEELRREIAFRARTDCVYLIENYTAGNMLNIRRPWATKNNLETHYTVLMIVRQCVEFAKLRRSHSIGQTENGDLIGIEYSWDVGIESGQGTSMGASGDGVEDYV